MDDARLLLLSAHDNVAVAREDIAAGERIEIAGVSVVLRTRIARGHKLARLRIAEGMKVLKYNAPIGTATVVIEPGEHVHVHNLRSDYTPTHVIGTAPVKSQ